MTSPDLSRLLQDLRKDPDLLTESRTLLGDPEAALRWAGERGYCLSLEDVAELLDSDRELSDDDLEEAAGGDAWPPA
jgi:predicted ribosomally synthesized peptide with nif11-like leader